MRADESPARAKKKPFVFDDGHISKKTGKKVSGASNGKREVWNWLPLHEWTEAQVWGRIDSYGLRNAGLVHFAYGLGMPRLSCCFCIFAPKAALVIAGHHNPELLAEYVRVEKKIGHTFRVDLSMAQVAEAVAAGEKPKEVANWKM
jgi:3'-phosphoadenosine 5'-phosphosulfate sulfotransferase (PAPS reductase)/FAD synthetase